MASISTGDTAYNLRTRDEMPRAASYTYLRHASENKPQHSDTTPSLETAHDDESHLDDDTGDNSTSGSSGFTTPDEYPELTVPPASADILLEELKRVPSARTRRSNDHFYDSKSSFESSFRHSNSSLESAHTGSTGDTSLSGSEQGPTETKRTSRRFGRHSWYGLTSSDSSRSPSPLKAESVPPCPPIPDSIPTPPPKGHIRKKSLIRGRDTIKMFKGAKLQPTTGGSKETEDPKKSPVRRATLLKKRPISGIFRSATSDIKDESHHEPVPVPPLPPSFSAEKLPIVWSSVLPVDRGIVSPRLAPPERPRSRSRSATRKKDELWSVFRSLEADFVKFSSKTSALKTNVVRDSLLPFLRGYAEHASNDHLRPEDLERRVNILNLWWTGLIDMLHGKNSLSLSGTDRPAVLDGIVGIMERPEWRQSPSPFSPLAKRRQPGLTPSHSTSSLTSSTSDFLAESVHHHVRNVFIQKLTAQMIFVVDKMSLRNTSASLVIFCGKACAYAFAFVPGMADILVRLWATPKDTILRVIEEHGVGKFDSMPESISSPVVSNFPPALQQLGFVSLAKCVRKLRSSPQLPLGTAEVPWWGRWVDRWRGHESDLFYVFVKHFHILASDFLPPDSSPMERLCIPGLVLVHAQMLFNLDATIHRDANQLQGEFPAASTLTFDDLLADPDAVATTLPVLPNTAVRFMAENRLIMLIRDFLSERTAAHPQARQMFAQSVNALLQATAKKTSMFDHGACFTLLDFLEEAFVLLLRYEQLKELDGRLVDSGFWLEVYRRMIGSENTMTDIRLYAFLYTLWNTIAPDWGRKMSVCLDLLLERSIFESRFNHWCPMVRAYYMRLLCWRVLRYDGEEHDGDLQIMETMRTRLQENWSHYLTLRRQAEQHVGFFPTSNPCNAAPGRRLLIMRIDAPLAPDTSFMSFDGAVRSTRGDHSAAKGGAHAHTRDVDLDGAGDSEASGKGIGGFLRKMAWTSSASRSRSKSPNPSSENVTGDVAADEIPQPAPKHRNFSFRFSLEPQHHHHHHHHQHQHNNHHHHYPVNSKRLSGHPPMRLQPPRLPSPAQAFLQSQVPDGMITSLPMAADAALVPDSTARYCGRALAEWTIVVGECQSFFERRRNEGVPCDRLVETPALGVETFRRPS